MPWPIEGVRVCLYGLHGAIGPVAEALRRSGVEIACVATQRPESAEADDIERELARHRLFEDPAAVAERLGAPLVRAADPAVAIEPLMGHGTNLVISLSAPIFRLPFLDRFDGWVVNFHGSKVYRGRAGLTWNLLNGLDGDAVVLHWIDPGIDTGAWIDEEPYRWDERAVPLDLFRAQIPCFVALAERLAGRLREGRIPSSPPVPGRAYLPGLRTDRDGWIDWRWSAVEIDRTVRAFGPPYGGASSQLEPTDRGEPRRVRIGRGSIETRMKGALHPLAAGAVLAGDPEGDVIVACGRGAVRLVSLRVEGAEVPAGRLARVGMRFRGRA